MRWILFLLLAVVTCEDLLDEHTENIKLSRSSYSGNKKDSKKCKKTFLLPCSARPTLRNLFQSLDLEVEEVKERNFVHNSDKDDYGNDLNDFSNGNIVGTAVNYVEGGGNNNGFCSYEIKTKCKHEVTVIQPPPQQQLPAPVVPTPIYIPAPQPAPIYVYPQYPVQPTYYPQPSGYPQPSCLCDLTSKTQNVVQITCTATSTATASQYYATSSASASCSELLTQYPADCTWKNPLPSNAQDYRLTCVHQGNGRHQCTPEGSYPQPVPLPQPVYPQQPIYPPQPVYPTQPYPYNPYQPVVAPDCKCFIPLYSPEVRITCYSTSTAIASNYGPSSSSSEAACRVDKTEIPASCTFLNKGFPYTTTGIGYRCHHGGNQMFTCTSG